MDLFYYLFWQALKAWLLALTIYGGVKFLIILILPFMKGKK
jgi:hypothetical protein